MKKLLLFSLAAVLLGISANAQSIKKNELDQYFETLKKQNKVSGVFSIAKEGNVIYQYAMGEAAANQTIQPNQKFRIGSISKTFTAAMIFKAIESGRINLETRLSTYFPQVPNAGIITIQHLLSHRSGLKSFTDRDDYLQWHTRPQSQTTILDKIIKDGFTEGPGLNFEYSNTNYWLLSVILEKIYNKPYADILKSQITLPLGLKNTYVGGKTELVKNSETNSFNMENGNWVQEQYTHPSVPLGAGAIVSNGNDLSLFINALMTEKIIAKPYLTQMLALNDNVGMGIFAMPYNDKQFLGHTGSIDGYSSMLGYNREDGVTVSVLSNRSDYNLNDVSIALLAGYYGDKLPTVDTTKAIQVEEKILSTYAGTYANKDFPLELNVFVENGKLMAQGTGQSAFPLTAINPYTFIFTPANIKMKFDGKKGTMEFSQGEYSGFFHRKSS